MKRIVRTFAHARDVCIVAAARSPICAYKGEFAGYSTVDLSALTVTATLEKFGIEKASIQEFFLGNVYGGNLGQAPAKQVAIKAGLSDHVVSSTINKVCSSGMLAVCLASMTIKEGLQDVVLAGGADVMTHAPYYKERVGQKQENIDGLIKDGLWDARYDVHMGECAELCSEKYNISREEMDEFSQLSFAKALKAWEIGKFTNEVVPISHPDGNSFIELDSLKGANATFSKLKPAFRKTNGKITSGNASPLSDGAAMLVLSSREKAQQMNWPVLATVESYAHAEQNNLEFTTTPNLALRKAVERAGVALDQLDYFELNEAFSVVGIANTRLLQIDPSRVNIYGGAVALGHPLGCSGARIIVTLISALKQERGKYGGAAICNGGGGASAIVIKA